MEEALCAKKILIVDDDSEIRELVDLTLGSNGYQIFHAANGPDAIETARMETPDLIIMDIIMPGTIDGLEATRILKNDPETRDKPIIILSGRGQEIEREEGLEAGATDYFTKPFSPLALIKKIEEVLE